MNDLLYTLIVLYSGVGPNGITLDATLVFDGFDSEKACLVAGADLKAGLRDPSIMTFEYDCVQLPKPRERT